MNSDFEVNDWVISMPNNMYKFLVGRVISIDRLGTSKHDTDNLSDDIHVNFTAITYSSERIIEIEKMFFELMQYKTTFDDLSLDDVIMSPDMLVNISNMNTETIQLIGNSQKLCENYILSNKILDTHDIAEVSSISA